MSRVLVTGAGGHIGRALVADLAGRGHEVISLYHRTPPPLPAGPSHRLIRADVADDLAGLPPSDWVIHAAAATHLDPTLSAADYARSNVCGTLNVLEHARRVGAQGIVLLSTLTVYGRIETGRLTEATEPQAANLYGRSKRLAEEILLDAEGKLDVVCLRLPGVTGPGDHRAWLGRTLLALYRGEPVHFASGDRPFNNIVEISELNRLIRHLLAQGPARRRCLVNVAASEPLPLASLLAAMRAAAGSPSPLHDDGPRLPCFWIDTERLQRDLDFRPATTLDQAMQFVRSDLATVCAQAQAPQEITS